MNDRHFIGHVEHTPRDPRRWLSIGAGLALALVGCEYSPDRAELEAKVAAAEEGRFGNCIDESYRAGVELQVARDRLRSLQEGSPSDSELAEGIAAAERAQALRATAEQTCREEQAELAEAERVRVLDVQAGRLVRIGAPVLVAGYASATGSEQHNLVLSSQRAEAVRAYLVERGVDPGLVSARGFGMADPIASNETEGGRRRNQRIELQFQ